MQLINGIKSKQQFPHCLQTSIHKKGKLKNFNTDIATVFRKICDSLKFNDEYSKIEYNLPDCKVGGRNKKTIQDINFVLKPTITSIKLKLL